MGMGALWLIVLSCLIKVVVQQELGRYVISSGETTFQALDRIPGPKWRVSWVVWAWVVMFCATTMQLGGILGGLGQTLALVIPQLSVESWTVVMAGTVVAILLIGQDYGKVEIASIFMVVTFTSITVACAFLLAWTPYRLGLSDISQGFSFGLPSGGLGVAFAVFGITGVGASELITYPYWCLGKGYARFVGPNTGSLSWKRRATGWIRVMQIDTIFAMFVYTTSTVAFYILGARVLYGEGIIPSGYEMINTLSDMYTRTLGPWAFYLFLLGAFFVLYSTFFASMAANTRVLVDFLQLTRFVEVQNKSRQLHLRRVIVVTLVLISVFWHSLVGQPVFMVVIGGIAQACLLPVIGFSALYYFNFTSC